MPTEDLHDLFSDLPVKDGIHRVSYHPDVSNYSADQEQVDIEPLDIQNKGFSVNEVPDTGDHERGRDLKKDIEMVAESVDRGYSDLDRATKIKVFRELLQKYKDPVIAKRKLIALIRESKTTKPEVKIVSSELKTRVRALLGQQRNEFPDDFDLPEFISFSQAWEKDPSLQSKSFKVRETEGRSLEVTGYITDLKAAGFKIPEGMERVGESEGNFVQYLAKKYAGILKIIRDAAVDEGENLTEILYSIQEDAFAEAMDKFMEDGVPMESVGFRRLF